METVTTKVAGSELFFARRIDQFRGVLTDEQIAQLGEIKFSSNADRLDTVEFTCEHGSFSVKLG